MFDVKIKIPKTKFLRVSTVRLYVSEEVFEQKLKGWVPI